MESQFFAQLLDLGITGLFIGYLLWMNKTQTQRLDSYVERLLETLAGIEKEREEGYDISKYDTERDNLLIDISGKLDEGLKTMHSKYEEERLSRLARDKSR